MSLGTRAPGLLVGRATREDLPGLVALECRSQPHPWSASGFEAELRQEPPGGILVVRQAGAPRLVAYCAFRTVADELHIHNLAVDPRFRRRGLADLLLGLALAMGRRSGCRTAELEVRSGNRPALALYEAHGIGIVGRRRGYYSSPPEDALLLRGDLVAPTLNPASPA